MTADDQNVQRLIGALEAQAKAFDRALNNMHVDMESLRAEVRELNQKLATIEGGRKMLWGLLMAAAGIGGTIVAAASAFVGKS